MNTEIRTKLQDILLEINIGRLSREYFNKRATWLYDKLNGEDNEKNPVTFTNEEIEQLKGALCDLADRIRKAADTL